MEKIKIIKNWIKDNKLEFALIVLVLGIAAFLRLYKISEYMTFLGDEGRDVMVVRKLLVYADPILVGPGTSIGNMYLGPLYYYFMAPALWLFNYSPVGPAVQIAVLGIVTVWLVWWVGREWFGKWAAIVAAGLYAISPTVIIYAKSSWNPNIMPFFALLCIYSVWSLWHKKEFRWLIVLGISFAFVLQSHYLGLLLAPVLGIYWILTLMKVKRERRENKRFWKYSVLGLVVFLFLMSPLVIFDARHEWRNFGAIKTFFTQREQTVSIVPWKSIPNLWPTYQEYITRLVGGRDVLVGKFAAFGIFDLFILYFVFRRKKLNETEKKAYGLLALWLLAATIGLGLYKQHIYDHYYGFFFAAPFLLTGALVSKALGTRHQGLVKTIAYCLIAIALGMLVIASLANSPLRYPPNRQLQRAEVVARKVIEVANDEPFNFALIAQQNYEAGYRYFLDLYRAKVVDIDFENKNGTIKDQLLVVCESPREKCDPTHNAKAEIAHWGWSKIEQEWNVFGVTLYKLGHTK